MAKKPKKDELKEMEKMILSGELEGEKAALLVQLAIAKRLEEIKNELRTVAACISGIH